MTEVEFISESVTPDAGTSDVSAMSRGMPGLPSGFIWRDRHYEIRELINSWKHSESETHRPGGERYYRKHYFKIRVDTGEVMVLYALRQMKRGENPKRRWWLHTIEHASESS